MLFRHNARQGGVFEMSEKNDAVTHDTSGDAIIDLQDQQTGGTWSQRPRKVNVKRLHVFVLEHLRGHRLGSLHHGCCIELYPSHQGSTVNLETPEATVMQRHCLLSPNASFCCFDENIV